MICTPLAMEANHGFLEMTLSTFPIRAPRLSGSIRLSLLFCFALLLCMRASAVTWFPVGPDGGDARSLASDPKDPKHLFLGTATGWVYQSRDGGRNWEHLAKVGRRDDLILDNIVVDLANTQHILVSAWVVDRPDGGLFESQDGGHTWAHNQQMQGQSIRALAQSASNPAVFVAGSLKGVYRSEDGGKDWVRISPAESKEIHEIESIAIDPLDPDVIYAGTWHLPWKTTDGGEHWQNIKQGVIDDSDVFSIIIDPKEPKTVYASACSGIYKSTDAGEMFHKVQGIPSTARRTRVLMQHPQQADTVFAGTTEGLFRTMDAGQTWERMTEPNLIVNDIYIDPKEPDHMLLATDRAGVLASADGGMTFQSSNRGFSARQVTSFASDVRNPARLFVGVVNDKGSGGVFESENGGITWMQHSLGLGGRDVLGLVEAADGTLVAGTNQGFYRWQDEGWIPSGQVAQSKTARSDGPHHAGSSAKGSATSGKSHPSGAKSHAVSSKSRAGSKMAAAKKSPDTKPSDLNAAASGEFAGTVFSMASGENMLYAATSEGMLRSKDSGENWSMLKLPGDGVAWRYVCAAQKAVLVADTKVLAISYDEGENWKQTAVPAGLTGVVALALDGSGALWVGGREGLFVSTNQGDTWTKFAQGPSTDINSVFYDGAGKRMLLTAGDTSTVAFAIELGDKRVTAWDSYWNLRFVRPVGEYLIGATLYDGMVLQPRMVVSPVADARH